MGAAKRIEMERAEPATACAACDGFGVDDVVSRAYALLYEENQALRAEVARLRATASPKATEPQGAERPSVEERLARLERQVNELRAFTAFHAEV